jgi:hypothetical protein
MFLLSLSLTELIIDRDIKFFFLFFYIDYAINYIKKELRET